MTAVAFLRQGRMGVPMAGILVAAGHQTAVWNRTKEKCAAAGEQGARVADTAADAVCGADIVITMLRDADSVDAVLFANGHVADAMAPGAVLLEMSTIGPDGVPDLRARLRADFALVDAPVIGSVPQATAGQLRILAGGAESDLARTADVFAVLGSVEWIGDLGVGASAKLVANLVTITAFSLIGESLALGGPGRLKHRPDIGPAVRLGYRRVRRAGARTVGHRPGAHPVRARTGGKGPGARPGRGCRPCGHGGRGAQELAAAVTSGLSGQDISAVVADMRSRAHTVGIKETRGQ